MIGPQGGDDTARSSRSCSPGPDNDRTIAGLYRATIDAFDDMIHVIDADYRITLVNSAFNRWCDRLGIATEPVGTNLFAAFPFLGEEIREEYERVFRSGHPLVSEETTEVAGTEVITETRKIPIIDNGKVSRIVTAIRDMTEARRSQRALLESERLLQEMFDGIQDGISLLDGDFVIRRVNSFMEKTYAAEMPIVGRKCYEVYQHRDAPCPWCPSLLALRQGEAHCAEVPYPDEDDPKGWMELSAYPMKSEDGVAVGVIEIVKDVTERKLAEERNRENETRYRAISELISDFAYAFSVSPTGVMSLRWITGAFERITGYSPEAFDVGLDWIDIIHPEDCEAPTKQLQALLEDKASTAEYRILTKDGRTRWLRNYARPSYDKAEGRVTAIYGAVQDITEHNEADEIQSVLFHISQAVGAAGSLEELLTSIHGQLGRLIDTKNFYVALYDEETETYSFPYHVDECEEPGDFTPVSLKKSLTDYVRRTGEPLFVDEETQERLMEKGEVDLVGVPSPVWIGVPLRSGHDVFGVVVVQSYHEGTAYDVKDLELLTFVSEHIAVAIERKRSEDERRKLEAQVQHAQKLESLGVLAGGIAHDFNNLLTGILGNADLAITNHGEPHRMLTHLKSIRKAAERAADLCGQMLAYSGRGSFVVEPLDVNEVVRDMVDLLSAAVSKNVDMHCELTPEIPAVEGDATQIRQILMNLITNASDAVTEGGGRVSIRTGVRECDRAVLAQSYLDDRLPEGTYVCLEVTDDGSGMDGETLQRIFDPFFSTKFTGRGLGLAAVLGIVRGHRGAVQVESAPGEGTSFRILLPACERCPEVASDARAQAAANPEKVSECGTVLLVDDEETVREIGRLILESTGYTVVTAADGQEAIEIYSSRPDDVCCVLLDLTMPHMDGVETLERLRGIRNDVKVVISSGYSAQEVAGRFADGEPTGFVQKPYLAEKLLSEIGRAIGGGRQIAN